VNSYNKIKNNSIKKSHKTTGKKSNAKRTENIRPLILKNNHSRN
jgi:hypothetical protein